MAYFLACLLLDQPVQLVGVGMLQRHLVHVFGFFVLANFAAPQDIPAMVGGNPVEPSGKRARLVVLAQLAFPKFGENFHGRVFRIFPSWQRSPAKPEDGWSHLPIDLTPSLGIPCTSPGNCLRGLRHSRHAHRAWSQRFHRLVRRGAPKTYTTLTNSNIAGRGYLFCVQHSTRNAPRDHGRSNILAEIAWNRSFVNSVSRTEAFPAVPRIRALA